MFVVGTDGIQCQKLFMFLMLSIKLLQNKHEKISFISHRKGNYNRSDKTTRSLNYSYRFYYVMHFLYHTQFNVEGLRNTKLTT